MLQIILLKLPGCEIFYNTAIAPGGAKLVHALLMRPIGRSQNAFVC